MEYALAEDIVAWSGFVWSTANSNSPTSTSAKLLKKALLEADFRRFVAPNNQQPNIVHSSGFKNVLLNPYPLLHFPLL